MTLFEWLDGTLSPWFTTTGDNVVENLGALGHNVLKLKSDSAGNYGVQDVYVSHNGRHTKYDLCYYFEEATYGSRFLKIRLKPYSAGSLFTDDGYYVEMQCDPYTWTNPLFSIIKRKSGVSTTLISKQSPIEDWTRTNMISMSRDANGLIKLYNNNNLILEVTDVEDFIYTDMVVQKSTYDNTTPVYVDFIETDRAMNVEPSTLFNWADDTLGDWLFSIGLDAWGKAYSFETGEGIRTHGLWSDTTLQVPFTAITGRWIFNFIEDLYSTGLYAHPVTFYPILDIEGNGYAVRYGAIGTVNSIELIKVVNNVETVLATDYTITNQDNHSITFIRDLQGKIRVKLDDSLKIRYNTSTISNSTRIKMVTGASGNVSETWYGYVQYDPINSGKSSLKSLLEVPHVNDLKATLCIHPLYQDLKALLNIRGSNRSNDLKAYLGINNLISQLLSYELKCELTVNSGATGKDLTALLIIGRLYQSRLTLIGKILYVPNNMVNDSQDDTKIKYEDQGISIMIGGKVYV